MTEIAQMMLAQLQGEVATDGEETAENYEISKRPLYLAINHAATTPISMMFEPQTFEKLCRSMTDNPPTMEFMTRMLISFLDELEPHESIEDLAALMAKYLVVLEPRNSSTAVATERWRGNIIAVLTDVQFNHVSKLPKLPMEWPYRAMRWLLGISQPVPTIEQIALGIILGNPWMIPTIVLALAGAVFEIEEVENDDTSTQSS